MTVRGSDERSSRIYGHCEQQNYCANQKLKAFLPHSHSPPSCREPRERKKGLTAICNSVRFDYITRCRALSILPPFGAAFVCFLIQIQKGLKPFDFSPLWRRVRDLNPRDAHHAYTISNRAPSTTQPTLHLVKLFVRRCQPQRTICIIQMFCRFVNSFFEIF